MFWRNPTAKQDSLRVLVRGLRAKIESGNIPQYILTERNFGYRFIHHCCAPGQGSNLAYLQAFHTSIAIFAGRKSLERQPSRANEAVCEYPKKNRRSFYCASPVEMTILSRGYQALLAETLAGTTELSSRPERTRFPTSRCQQRPRMRLSLKRAARTRSTPRFSTGNPGERSGGTCGSFSGYSHNLREYSSSYGRTKVVP